MGPTVIIMAIVIGACIGAPLRYFTEQRLTAALPGRSFPWALLLINVSGCVLAGVAAAQLHGTARIFVITGICGSLTTFSGFGWSMYWLWHERKQVWLAALATMTIACIVGFWIAYWICTR